MTGRADAAALDDADELRAFHDRFVVADDGLIYLDGNSLGRLPRATAARLAEVVQGQWGERLIRAWSEGWMELPRTSATGWAQSCWARPPARWRSPTRPRSASTSSPRPP